MNNTQVYISTNGYLLFSPYIGCCSIIMTTPTNIIAALNMDIITSSGGDVFYRSINQSSSDLITIQSEINQLLQTNFIAKNAFVVTYKSVQAYSNRNDTANFQIILSTDSIRSYVTLNYGSCFELSNYFPLSEINCLDKGSNLAKQLIVNPCSSSNVNITGKWIFNITEECKILDYLFNFKISLLDY